VFGLKCPIRKGEIFGDLETWLEQDEMLKQWIELIRMTKKYKLSLARNMGFNESDLKKYFNGERKNISPHVLSEIEDWDNLAEKYDIPILGAELRRWNSDLVFDYLSKTYPEEKRGQFMAKIGFGHLLTVERAIEHGLMWCLKYALENGDLKNYKCYGGGYTGKASIDQNLILGRKAFNCMETAIRIGDIEMVKLLYENGFPDREWSGHRLSTDLNGLAWSSVSDYIMNNRDVFPEIIEKRHREYYHNRSDSDF